MAELASLRSEAQKAHAFILQAEATIAAYEMLVRRLDAPEEVSPAPSDAPTGA